MNSGLSHILHISKALNDVSGAGKSLYAILKYSIRTIQKIKLINPLLIFHFRWSYSFTFQIEGG